MELVSPTDYPCDVSNQEELLAQRYGKGRQRLSRKTKVVLASSGVLLLVLLAAIITAISYNPLSYKDLSFSVQSAQSVEVEFEVTAPPGSAVKCAIQALNNQFGVVGYKVFFLEPSPEPVNRYSVRLNTTELAVTGLVDSCELE